MRRRPPAGPYEMEIDTLDPRGNGVGFAPDGRPASVRPAAPGSRLRVRPAGRHGGGWSARRLELIRPAADGATPRCPVFGLCGGCTLQELQPDRQRALKQKLAVAAILAPGSDVTVHPIRHAGRDWGYRNKMELSFGTLRYLDEADNAAGLPREGRFLGMHAPGRFDRIVDVSHCDLLSEDANRLVLTVRRLALAPDAPAPWDAHAHTGFWRFLMIREAPTTGTLLVGLFTADLAEHASAVTLLAEALLATPLEGSRLASVLWITTDSVADVARGALRQQWGDGGIIERLGPATFHIGPNTFFQPNSGAAAVLYDTVALALGTGTTLLDLYCGVGSIGLYVHSQFLHLRGVEEVGDAVEAARANARSISTNAEYHHGKVEDALEFLYTTPPPRHVVVDPPRVGLHPKVVAALATFQAEVLVYVACHSPSLGRDRLILEQGGWHMTDLWTVDLFPQTHHVEAVARFVRPASPPAVSDPEVPSRNGQIP